MSKFGLQQQQTHQQQWWAQQGAAQRAGHGEQTREYHVGAVIGVGAFGEVRECVDARSQQRFAAKIVDVARWSAALRARIENEARVLRRLQHPFVIRLHRVHEAVPFRGRFCLDCGCSHFAAQHLPRAPYQQTVRLAQAPSPGKKPVEGPLGAEAHAKCKFCAPHGAEQHSRPETRHVTFLVQELAVGGELLSMIKCCGAFAEDVARHYFRQLIFGLRYLHDQGIVHRDIKLENLVLSAEFDLKIVDFGLAATLEQQDHEHLFHSGVGSLPYTAPEVKYQKELYSNLGYRGPPADLWSAAVVLYIMLVGKPPFRRPVLKTRGGVKRCRIFARVMEGVYPDAVSDTAKDLLSRLFQIDPDDRYTVEDIMAHEWFNGYVRPTEELQSYIMERSTRLWKEADIPKMIQILHSMHAQAQEDRRRREVSSAQPQLRRRRSNGSSGSGTPPAPAANRAAVAAASVVAAAQRIVGESALRRAIQAAASGRRGSASPVEGSVEQPQVEGGISARVSTADVSSDEETEQEGDLTMPLPAFMTREARNVAQVAERAHEHDRQRRSERRKASRRDTAPSRRPAAGSGPTTHARRRQQRHGSRGSAGSNSSRDSTRLKEHDRKDDEHSVTSEAKSDTNDSAAKDVIPPPPDRAPPPAPGPVSFEANIIEDADIPLPSPVERQRSTEEEGQSVPEDEEITQEDQDSSTFQPTQSAPDSDEQERAGPLVEWKVLSKEAARLLLTDQDSLSEQKSGSSAPLPSSPGPIASQCEISCNGPPELLMYHVRKLCEADEGMTCKVKQGKGLVSADLFSDSFRCSLVVQPQDDSPDASHRIVLHRHRGTHEEFVRLVYDLRKRVTPFS